MLILDICATTLYNQHRMALHFEGEETSYPHIYKSNELTRTSGPLPQKPQHHSYNLNPQDRKQKVQLCRQFMDLGYCPYQSKCKFAHGIVQLLKNQQANMKYKTKVCQNYNKRWCCLYGARCNFIHQVGLVKKARKKKDVQVQLGMIKQSVKEESRLMLLLKSDSV